MPSAKTSTFIRLFDCLCIFMQHLFRSLLPFIIARCRVALFGFVPPQTLPPASTNGFSLCGGHFAFSRATGVLVQRFALNSSIDLLFALTADAFCLRRVFAEPPRDCAFCLGRAFSFGISPTLPFCLTPPFFYYIII